MKAKKYTQVNNINRDLYHLFISEFERQCNREDGQSKYIIKSKVIGSLRREYIKNISIIVGKLQRYFSSGLNLTFNSDGVTVKLKPLVEKEYICHSHLVARWGNFGRHLVQIFAPNPDKVLFNTGNPKQLYLTERIKNIEASAAFSAYINMFHENRLLKKNNS